MWGQKATKKYPKKKTPKKKKKNPKENGREKAGTPGGHWSFIKTILFLTKEPDNIFPHSQKPPKTRGRKKERKKERKK